ncbi:hypothetical protein [Leptospirillum ferriphilum]|uniref:hypothetical protein n=1 Tax=Leptospirillum ferriphilum TaxID=178606 RepID=UPI0006B1D9A7|nr:hypothetical protein [Leptospirillum ferriphilum]
MEAQLVFILDGLAESFSPTTLEIAQTPFLDSFSERGEAGLVDLGWDLEDPSSESGILRLCGASEVEKIYSRSLLLYGAFHSSGPFTGRRGVTEEDRKWVWILNPATVSDGRLDSYVEDSPPDSFWRGFLERAARRKSPFRYLPVHGSAGHILRVLATHPVDGQPAGDSRPPRRGDSLPEDGLVADLIRDGIACVPPGSSFNCVWPWGMGKWEPENMHPGLEQDEKWMIAGSPLPRAIGKILGWKTPCLTEATGDVDTSIVSKGKAICEALDSDRTTHVFCHLEGFDLASHRRNRSQKIRFLEEFDRVMGPVLQTLLFRKRLKGFWFTCDHRSSPVTGNHEGGPVPYLYVPVSGGTFSSLQGGRKWTEQNAGKGKLHTIESWKNALGISNHQKGGTHKIWP